ncbi:MAG: potassium channel family protein [Alphaproteobacteria bacterium]
MSAPMPHRVGAILFTAALIVLVAYAVAETTDYFFYATLSVAVFAVAAFLTLFPGSLFFSLALANFLAVYASIFTFIKITNFEGVSAPVTSIGLVLPVLAFVIGSAWHRKEIRAIVTSPVPVGVRELGHVFGWLAFVGVIATVTFLVPVAELSPANQIRMFLGSMAVSAGVVLIASRHVSVFLIDAGLLFEGFFVHMARLAMPAFAFVTLYSLFVVIFACVYRIIDRHASQAMFRVMGEARHIDFPEALYFSVVTLSTVGYGDIVPLGAVVRVFAAFQVLCGTLLLLFGVSELVSYARRRRES